MEPEEIEQKALDAYHRAIRRHEERTGISYPLMGISGVETNRRCSAGKIATREGVLAKFKIDRSGRVRISLIE